MRAFISYSHRDEAALDLVHQHLVMLRREQLITEWYDRKIVGGDVLDDKISESLEGCDLFIALVSPDFLNSAYCYEREMQRAIERHAEGTLRIVPIIVEPCEWTASPLGRFKALPKDGKPINEWANRHNAGLNIATELRRIAEGSGVTSKSEQPVPARRAVPSVPSGRYRIERDFDEIDKAEFRDQAFKEIRDYFEVSISEVNSVEGLRGRFRDINQQGFTCTVLNRMKHGGQAHITVYAGGARTGFGDITYSFSESAPMNTANGWIYVKADKYDLYLELDGMSRLASSAQRVTVRTAAELLWKQFLENAGVVHD